MAPLSRELSGVILPHDHYGSHLDNSGKTIDSEKEKQNFEYAGQALAEIWSNTIIDGYPVVSEYIVPENSEFKESKLIHKNQAWQDIHVSSNQYFLQIVKCKNSKCCTAPRSSIFKSFPDRFLPPPLAIDQSDEGLIISEKGKFASLFVSEKLKSTIAVDKFNSFKKIPYDIMCPSIQKEIKRKVCSKCSTYIVSIGKFNTH